MNKTYDNSVRKPRAAKVTRRMKTIIRRLSESDRHLTSEKIRSETGFQISARTVRRILQNSGLHGRVARKKPFVSKINRQKRLQFAKEHLEWTEEDWAKVIFTDESKFCLHGSDGRSYVRRRIGEEFDSKCTKPTMKYGGGSLMVWGSMRRVGVGPICKIDGILNAESFVNILQNTFLPYKRKIRGPIIHQQDNDPKHTSALARKWFADHRINVMKWPPQSPDLNPIEMLWIDVDKAIKEKAPVNKMDLENCVINAWNNIPKDRCIRLVDSMKRRCMEVIERKGYPTSY